MKFSEISFTISKARLQRGNRTLEKYLPFIIIGILGGISIMYFAYYLQNGLGLAYNDARSHLDIGRRVVEGLKPGIAQLGSVWLPLPHLLMVPTIWHDFMWHTGLAGAIQSMISYVFTAYLIYAFLRELKVGLIGRLVGVAIFAFNVNILYLQSTAMTELLLLVTLTAGAYELLLWHKNDRLVNLVRAAFWIMLASLNRYEGWFLFIVAGMLVAFQAWRKHNIKAAEGSTILYATLAGLGIALWFLWNLLIFKDPLYFAFGPFSAHAQQAQLEGAGVLVTKGNLFLSAKMYYYALMYNSVAFFAFLGGIGAFVLWLDKRVPSSMRVATLALIAPLVFNILALYLGHSVLFIQGLSGNTWFNVRYGVMLIPSLAIFIGYLIERLKPLRWSLVGIIAFTIFIAFSNADAVTIDDARVGSSQKNVSEASSWLAAHAKNEKGFILISVASHDAIIFSSGLPMKRFIHEGTGGYWESATIAPDRWARWVVMRTHDDNDLTFKLIKNAPGFVKYTLVQSFPFADIYEMKPEFLGDLNYEPILGKQK